MKKPSNIKISGKADKMNVKIPNKQIYTIIPTMYKMHMYLGKSISSRWKNDFNFFIVHLKLQNMLIIRMHRVKHKSKRKKVFSKTLINKPKMQNTNKNLFFWGWGGRGLGDIEPMTQKGKMDIFYYQKNCKISMLTSSYNITNYISSFH